MKLLIILLPLFLLSIIGCDRVPESDRIAQESSERLMMAAQSKIGMPNIVNFQEKSVMKHIMELRDDENLICHAYISTFTGIHYLGRCVGYGLPYSTQYTNPEKRVISSSERNYSLPQAEANGLFTPTGLSATWLILLDSTDTPRVVYVESNLIVSPVKMEIEGKNSSL